MIWNNWSTRGPIGLDVGSRFIKAAQVSGRASRPRLATAMVLERSEPGKPLSDAEVARLCEVLRRRGFVGRQVVAAVPGPALLSSVLELPPRSSGAPLQQIAAAELSRAHRCGVDEMTVAFWELPRSARSAEGVQVMAAGCRHDHGEALLAPLLRQGLDVVALDLQSWAIARATERLGPESAGLVAAVDLGWQAVTLVLLHGGTVIYERTLGGVGLAALVESIEREERLERPVIETLLRDVGLDEDALRDSRARHIAGQFLGPLESHFEQVAQELRLSMGYASNQYPEAELGKLLLTGGGAAIPGLAAHLSTRLEVQVTPVTPAMVCPSAPGLAVESAASALMIALGLAWFREEVAA